MAATRFYLGALGNAVIPAFDGSWEKTSSAARNKMGTVKDNSVFTSSSFSAFGTNPSDTLHKQYHSDIIQPQTISGTVKGQILASENAASNNYMPQCVIYVVKADASAVLATLYANDVSALSHEFATVLTNAKYPRGAPVTLTPYTLAETGRIVVEVGLRQESVATANGILRFGGNAASDLPEDETTTGDNNTWIEFSADLFNPPAVAGSSVRSLIGLGV